MSPANTPDLKGHISELEEMHEVAESDLVKLTLTTFISSCIGELEFPEPEDAETDPPEKHQDNGAMLPVNTQPSPPHSPLEDALVAPAAPPPQPRVESRDAALQA